ncbi:NAD(P)-dependent alcohol dehydrogenase [Arthrobacter sp. zg-Y1171]|uniref:NAD(P)-dependent alcohol dehydrogenase n=1 Tax=Arthrobacter sp. zg-Y1171 TaxID=2964610 RepID=UPI0021074FBA|nr:NAD(P)-dependent alcohol dehydrogenase [Arthrobacter sp. zg-Y1171]MCQ1995749.1 NAD(P)-dependent alcohol dehydrogenase [Arthrobacter sp. zg-Y1171]UWX83169.1 NAD(P)-dependent alcohol dehydrogenase [Arthrobacter sp. zg-Y1171]
MVSPVQIATRPTRTVSAYAAISPTDPLVATTIERRSVGAKDVLIEIAYVGICHSDIHTVRGDWGPVQYPLTVGHEIVGVVSEIGADVTQHQVGDRVGVGCLVNSCRECANCRAGAEQYCLNGNTATYGAVDRDGTITQGGYSTHIVVVEDFVLSIPQSIPYEAAAPLLCAGITTYSPLAHWNAGPGKKVAVIGMGGLGHMAVKISHAMGAETTVLSHPLSKQEDGLRFGADYYYATSDPATFETLANTFDLIINTVSAKIDVDAYLLLLGLDGTMVNIGAPTEVLPVQVYTLCSNRRSFAGTGIGSIRETQDMLDFCAEHGIAPEIELIAADAINDAYERVLASDVRYRFVIDTATLPAI